MAKTPTHPFVLLYEETATGAGQAVDVSAPPYDNDERNFVAYVEGSGAVSATVLVQVSNNNRHWVTLGSISLSGTTSASDGFVADESWQWVRGNVSAISGTGAKVTLTMGV